MLSKLNRTYHPEPNKHIRNKINVELDLSNYTTKKDLHHTTGVDIYDLAAKKSFIALKATGRKLVIVKLINVMTSLNNLKTKVDDLDVGKLKTAPVHLKKLSEVVDNEIVKNTKFNTLKGKVNNLDKNILMRLLWSTLINITQINKI